MAVWVSLSLQPPDTQYKVSEIIVNRWQKYLKLWFFLNKNDQEKIYFDFFFHLGESCVPWTRTSLKSSLTLKKKNLFHFNQNETFFPS